MARVTIKVEGSNVGTVEIVRELDTENSAAFTEFLVAEYGTRIERGERDGQPFEDVIQQTPQDMVKDAAGWLIEQMLKRVTAHRQELAVRAAAEAVKPVTANEVAPPT